MTDLKNEIADNDMLRRSFEGGCVEISPDVASSNIIEAILDGVRNYDSHFSEHKNEQDDHGFGLINFNSDWVFWEIAACAKSNLGACKCTLKKTLKIYYDYEM